MKKFIINNRNILSIFIWLLNVIPIFISVRYFHNDYWGTIWHWILSFICIPTFIILLAIKEKKGCLDGKTPEQVDDFFKSLLGFLTTDKDFFIDQFNDLTIEEQQRLYHWLKLRNNFRHFNAQDWILEQINK